MGDGGREASGRRQAGAGNFQTSPPKFPVLVTHKAAGCRFYVRAPPPSAELAVGSWQWAVGREAEEQSGHGILPWCAREGQAAERSAARSGVGRWEMGVGRRAAGGRQGRETFKPPHRSFPSPLRTKRQDAASTSGPRRLRRSWQLAVGSWQLAGRRKSRVATASCRGVRGKDRRRRGALRARELGDGRWEMGVGRRAAGGGQGRETFKPPHRSFPSSLRTKRQDAASTSGPRRLRRSWQLAVGREAGGEEAEEQSGHGILPWCAREGQAAERSAARSGDGRWEMGVGRRAAGGGQGRETFKPPHRSFTSSLRIKRQDAASTSGPRRLRRSWQLAVGSGQAERRRKSRVATASCRGVRGKGRRRRGALRARELRDGR
jgi:hypothetical protein